MENSGNSSDFMTNPKSPSSSSSRANFCKKQKVSDPPSCLKIPSYERSRFATIDVVILIAVIAAFGFRLFPTLKSISLKVLSSLKLPFIWLKMK
ncbi:Dof zinc finger protein DOF5.2 [Hibiscus syriacus]|uniref:Dof zinc finger protein DOF5.2 n=1 Tax=Hibiscus syriacus TaxID=106335 RepID=A0A6A2ZV55_HIBSY|nr:Dof zinc finger protein DOF5.2 [Hibiscus syriacus]